MKNLILATVGLMMIGAILIATVAHGPQPKAKVPDPRYIPSAISANIIKNVQDYTVLISNESMDERWRGTGILLSSTTVLTCAHVIPKNKSTKTLWIYPYPGSQVIHAKLKFINYPNDLALLELETPALGHKTPILAQKVELGEPIVSVGNIHGFMMWFTSYGIISGEHERWILTDAAIRGGNSGGPWANAKGEIVALTDVGWEDPDDGLVITGGVPVQDLRKFLAEAQLKKPDIIYAMTGN